MQGLLGGGHRPSTPLCRGLSGPGPSWAPTQGSGFAGGEGQGGPGSGSGNTPWASTTQGTAHTPISWQRMQGRDLLGGGQARACLCAEHSSQRVMGRAAFVGWGFTATICKQRFCKYFFGVYRQPRLT